jgi:hypothetical protein
MKKYLLLTLLCASLCIVNNAKAQIVTAQQDDMEIWNNDPANGSAMDPNTGMFNVPCWQTLNVLSTPLIGPPPHPVSVFKDSTIVHSGSYSCRIISVVFNATAYGYLSSFVKHDTIGMLFTGTLTNAPSYILGMPYATRSSAISFWYQYTPQMNAGKPDTASCTVIMTKNHIPIGSGAIKMNAAASWTQGVVNIGYSMIGNPDTIIVLFSSSSNYKPAPGSQLIIDGVTASAPLGVNELTGETAVSVYPNPASSEANFRIAGPNARTLEVYDITGKKINTFSVKDFMLTINTATYPTGIYIYRVYDKDGGVMKTGRFSINN